MGGGGGGLAMRGVGVYILWGILDIVTCALAMGGGEVFVHGGSLVMRGVGAYILWISLVIRGWVIFSPVL